MPPLPSRDAKAVLERIAVLYREVRHRKAQLRSRSARAVAPCEDRGLRLAIARKAESEEHLRFAGTPGPELFRKSRTRQRPDRRKPDHHAGTPPRQRGMARRPGVFPRASAAAGAARPRAHYR